MRTRGSLEPPFLGQDYAVVSGLRPLRPVSIPQQRVEEPQPQPQHQPLPTPVSAAAAVAAPTAAGVPAAAAAEPVGGPVPLGAGRVHHSGQRSGLTA